MVPFFQNKHPQFIVQVRSLASVEQVSVPVHTDWTGPSLSIALPQRQCQTARHWLLGLLTLPGLVLQLVQHLKLEFYGPGDVVARQGDFGHEMYFVGQGTLQVRLYTKTKNISLMLNVGQNGEDIEDEPQLRKRGSTFKQHTLSRQYASTAAACIHTAIGQATGQSRLYAVSMPNQAAEALQQVGCTPDPCLCISSATSAQDNAAVCDI